MGHKKTATGLLRFWFVFFRSLWATDHYQPLRMFAGHLADITCTRFHPNSNYVATGSADRTIRLWDVLTGNCVRILTGHKVRRVQGRRAPGDLFSPNRMCIGWFGVQGQNGRLHIEREEEQPEFIFFHNPE